jgi:thioredoxin reductase (NADPH)
LQRGGQLTTTTEIENFPGFAEPIHGGKLMEEMATQAQRVGTRILQEEVESVDFSRSPLTLKLSNGETLESHTVIIATGATAKTLGLPDESQWMGRGLSTCATCDGFFYRGKKTLVLGGGDSAMEEALYLANLCQEVILVHRRPTFRASPIMIKRAQNHPKIQIKTPYTIAQTLGDQTGVTGVILENTETGARETLSLDGVFYAIGHTPNSGLFQAYVDRDDLGYIRVQNGTRTRTPGVFAAGDIADPVFKQAITAAGMGCQAAIQAARYLEDIHS